jgi:hypothetical protein
MISIRTGRIAAVIATVALLLAAVAQAADGPATKVSASITPSDVGRNTPVALKLNLSIDHPTDSALQLQRIVVLFPKGSHQNGKLFKSCSAETLTRARGRLRACPSGSQIGRGIATGTAVDLGVTSTGRIAMFNGPGGKSVTFNVNITNPAAVNTSFKAPLKKLSGRYAYRLTVNIPPSLQTILQGPIIVHSINTRTAAYKTVNGVRRGYIEAGPCPRSGRAPINVTYGFSDGSTSTSNTQVVCK